MLREHLFIADGATARANQMQHQVFHVPSPEEMEKLKHLLLPGAHTQLLSTQAAPQHPGPKRMLCKLKATYRLPGGSRRSLWEVLGTCMASQPGNNGKQCRSHRGL